MSWHGSNLKAPNMGVSNMLLSAPVRQGSTGEVHCEKVTKPIRRSPSDCCKECPEDERRLLDHTDMMQSDGTPLCKFGKNYYQNTHNWHPHVPLFGEMKCITCWCDHGVTKCQRKACPVLTCSNIVRKEGKCCPECSGTSQNCTLARGKEREREHSVDDRRTPKGRNSTASPAPNQSANQLHMLHSPSVPDSAHPGVPAQPRPEPHFNAVDSKANTQELCFTDFLPFHFSSLRESDRGGHRMREREREKERESDRGRQRERVKAEHSSLKPSGLFQPCGAGLEHLGDSASYLYNTPETHLHLSVLCLSAVFPVLQQDCGNEFHVGGNVTNRRSGGGRVSAGGGSPAVSYPPSLPAPYATHAPCVPFQRVLPALTLQGSAGRLTSCWCSLHPLQGCVGTVAKPTDCAIFRGCANTCCSLSVRETDWKAISQKGGAKIRVKGQR
ncbi:hypothetical protein JZ751_001913 [Albula glossodonta]|uniref:VWFC domain-containing protein n=1 Tax=Albula glossodonta TaxID=121402 RepID=A0A8T2PFC5_9TELE|nr:hypothetical protein JZ751_001913 [Albula glossodonta]